MVAAPSSSPSSGSSPGSQGGSKSADATSRTIVTGAASQELVFAVVGHVGSGTSEIADALGQLLSETLLDGRTFDVEVIKARDIIREFGAERGKPLPVQKDVPDLADVEAFQNLGDEMRSEITQEGQPDYAAVARRMVGKIRGARARQTKANIEDGKPVLPDGYPRAYILDSIRHPEEVNLLRHIYSDAFILIGVVCEQERRCSRVQSKYRDAGRQAALEFMERDAGDNKIYGQHVTDAFHLSDFFVDNTPERKTGGLPNPAWDINEHLSHLIKILTHADLARPNSAETAMYHAQGAAMQSACLSRQVGAALIDSDGTVLATGSNEVPKAGGGVYGERFEKEEHDGRCAFREEDEVKFCRNTREQNTIISELISAIPELNMAPPERKQKLATELRRTRIGSLVEFSRAVHAEMDAILSAARTGVHIAGTRLFVTTFPCHYCARHIVTSGIDEVQYIEPYPKSRALALHDDAIKIERSDWTPPSKGGSRVLFRPFSGVAPRLYKRAFLKDRELKNQTSGDMEPKLPIWGQPWHLGRNSYVELEAELTKPSGEVVCKKPVSASS
jgi:deoxycytidylate deaminase